MNDRELLELAAKAAGYDVVYEDTYLTFFRQDVPGRPIWNPLNDDGDALRLTVKLGLTISPCKRGICVSRDEGEDEPFILEDWGANDNAATRRAIVKAAAVIGRGNK